MCSVQVDRHSSVFCRVLVVVTKSWRNMEWSRQS